MTRFSRALLSLTALFASAASAGDYSPRLDQDFPQQVFWGDTHLHTTLSQDANTFGVTLGPEDAYRFAKGERVVATHGQAARLSRPLDFLVVADHAEGLGAIQQLEANHPLLRKSERLQKWKKMLEAGDLRSRLAVADDGRMNGWPPEFDAEEIRRPAWDRLLKAAEAANEPGSFTALLGYEWTSWPGGSNLHRVVVFRDGVDKVGRVLPFSSEVSDDPEDLWATLARYEDKLGGRVLAIPHNGNLSNGLMFAVETRSGEPLSRDYAERRARFEPLVEVTQIKGDGETHPFLSPNDEFADYETWDIGNFTGVPKTDDMLQYEYARSSLRIGLAQEQKIGINPFAFGMIGATDSHTAIASAEEDNFFGKHSAGMEPSPKRMAGVVGKSGETVVMGWQQAASGYAAVWAHANNRESIWDAMQRKEVYGTTGPRITVRLFGGWGFQDEDATAPDLARVGYAKGVPMGGKLAKRPSGAKPSFLVAALRDPVGANLDRVQIVKGWVDVQGETHERVYDVAWSDTNWRQRGPGGRLDPVGNSVNVEAATWSNRIGAAQLVARWEDPDFVPEESAFYYARVLEIPTPRWTAYDAKKFGVEVPGDLPKTHQERAYTSPIWYAAR